MFSFKTFPLHALSDWQGRVFPPPLSRGHIRRGKRRRGLCHASREPFSDGGETHASLSFPYWQWRKSGEEAFYLSSSRKGRGMCNFHSSPCIGFSNFEVSLIVSCLGAAVLIHSFAHIGLFFLVTRGLKASFAFSFFAVPRLVCLLPPSFSSPFLLAAAAGFAQAFVEAATRRRVPLSENFAKIRQKSFSILCTI